MNKVLQVHNPNDLPTMPYTQFVEFQGDLKESITPEDLEKMRGSLKKHGVFVPKFVWFDEQQQANIMDGHQTKQALSSLEADGWTIPEIPYAIVCAETREDAAEKLLQINSRYAKLNPHTTWFDDFEFQDLSELLDSVEIPELSSMLDVVDLSIIEIERDEDFEEKDKKTTFCPKCGFEYEI